MLLKGNLSDGIVRESLRQQVVSVLREKILNGEIASGTKVTERDISDLLEVSRMPARDALMELEKEGLLDSRPGGRYVVELGVEDVEQLFAVRLVLERAAIEAAINLMTSNDAEALKAALAQMRDAIDKRDFTRYVKSDLEVHNLIWEFARNRYLSDMLNSIRGIIGVFMANHATVESWEEVYDLHDGLVKAVLDRDQTAAHEQLDRHMKQSLKLSLRLADDKQKGG